MGSNRDQVGVCEGIRHCANPGSALMRHITMCDGAPRGETLAKISQSRLLRRYRADPIFIFAQMPGIGAIWSPVARQSAF